MCTTKIAEHSPFKMKFSGDFHQLIHMYMSVILVWSGGERGGSLGCVRIILFGDYIVTCGLAVYR